MRGELKLRPLVTALGRWQFFSNFSLAIIALYYIDMSLWLQIKKKDYGSQMLVFDPKWFSFTKLFLFHCRCFCLDWESQIVKDWILNIFIRGFTFSVERYFPMDGMGWWVLRMSFWRLPERSRQKMSVVKCHLHLCCLQKKHKSDRKNKKNTKKTKKHKKTGNVILISAAHKKIQKGK